MVVAVAKPFSLQQEAKRRLVFQPPFKKRESFLSQIRHKPQIHVRDAGRKQVLHTQSHN